jgi:hypothetical protein
MTGVAKGTALSLLVNLGGACEQYQDRALRNLKLKRIQCDEIWEFCYAKSKNVPKEHAGEWGYGDVGTWVAIDALTKLVPSWAVGRRDGFTAQAFIRDLADRLSTAYNSRRTATRYILKRSRARSAPRSTTRCS